MAGILDPVPFSVKEKTAIVTGAGSGINLCFAQLLLAQGCNVIFADLSLRPEAQKLIDEHSSNAAGKARAVFIKTDVVQWDQLTAMFDTADKEFGGVDIVCPGAGVYEPRWSNFWHPPGSSSSKDLVHGTEGIGHYASIDIDLIHPIRATQLAISRWLNPSSSSRQRKVSPQNPKRVVHISSIAAQLPTFPAPLYGASKAGVSSFIRAMGPLESLGIRVTGVAPGVIKTPLWTENPDKLQWIDEVKDTWVEPEEVAQGMLQCCEDANIVGGYIMEILKDSRRKVDWRNDPGPSGEGASVSNAEVSGQEIFQWLSEDGWGVPK